MELVRKKEIIQSILPSEEVCSDLMKLAEKCANTPPEKDGWKQMQNDQMDRIARGIIYRYPTINQLRAYLAQNGVTDEKVINYTERRLLNTVPSLLMEDALCKAGATKCPDRYNKDCDVYFGNLPVDVKISVLSQKWDTLDFNDPIEVENYAWWNYENQSKGQRNNYQNRLIFVCCGDTLQERLVAKANLKELISVGLDYMDQGPNMTKLLVRDNKGHGHTVYYDIVPVNWRA